MGTDSIQRLAFEGPVSLWWLVPIGLLLIGLAVWLGVRDYRQAQRSRWVPVFITLRLTAILVLLWMLAGPTYITHFKHEQVKSVALFVDKSASMTLVDPVDESGNNLRWLTSESNSANPLKDLDRELARLAVLDTQMKRLLRSSGAATTASNRRDKLEGIYNKLETSPSTLREIADSLGTIDSAASTSLSEVSSYLEQTILPQISPSRLLEENATDQSALDALGGSIRQLQTLAERLAARGEATPSPEQRTDLATRSTRSRTDKVDELIRSHRNQKLGELEESGALLSYRFGEQVLSTSLPASSSEASREFKDYSTTTDLAAPLQQAALVRSQDSLEGAIILTDGGHNNGDDPVQIASSLPDVPLFVVPIGNTKMPRDVILHHTLGPRTAYQNDLVSIETMLTAYRCTGEQVRVELINDNQVVDHETLVVRREIFDTRVNLEWKAAELGRHTFQVRVVPLADEKSEENNMAELSVHVTEDKIRILIADNLPRWEFRYLINLFDRDDRVEYEQLIFEPRHSSTGQVPQPPTFPFDFEQWMRYRVVILGDVRPSQLTMEHQLLLRRYVTEFGGNVIIIAGKESMPTAYVNQPLEALLPVERADRAIDRRRGYSLSVTPEGSYAMPTQIESTPVASENLWRRMTQRLPLYSLSEYSQLKPTGHSLLAAQHASGTQFEVGRSLLSFLSWHYVGSGRVVYLAAPVSYQLRYRQGDLYHHRFWGQLLRWAIARDLTEGSRTVRFATDKSTYEQGEPVSVTASLFRPDGSPYPGGAPKLTVTQGDASLQELALTEHPTRPGVYDGTLNALPTGKIRLQLDGTPIPALLAAEGYDGAIETTINVDPSGSLEFRHPLCDVALLHRIAQAGNGYVIPPAGIESVLEQLDLEPEISETIQRRPIWNQWKYLWIFIICLSLEWAGRKLIGLV